MLRTARCGCSRRGRSAARPSPTERQSTSAHWSKRCTARGHELFCGKLDKSLLGFAERAIVAAVRAPEGDFRDWGAIEAWAGQIAGQLVAAAAV